MTRFPQEKHNTSLQSRRAGRHRRGGRRRWRCPAMNEHINCSNYVGASSVSPSPVAVTTCPLHGCRRRRSPAPVAVAGAGAVLRGMGASTVLIPSALEGSQPEVGDSVCPSPVVVTTFPQQAPPASGPELPQLSVHCPSTE